MTDIQIEFQKKVNEAAMAATGGMSLEELRAKQSFIKTVEPETEVDQRIKEYFRTVKSKDILPIFKDFAVNDVNKCIDEFKSALSVLNWNINNENTLMLKKICFWISANYMSKNEKVILNPKKGLFICGGTGNGKTTICNLIQKFVFNNPKYFFRRFKKTTMSKYLKQVAKGDVLDYSGNWFFDDIGVNYYEVAKVYGNIFHPLPFLLDEMYENFQRGGMLIVTSNLTPKEILYENPNEPIQEKRVYKNGFDERIRSRLFEMFNVIENQDIDRRFLT